MIATYNKYNNKDHNSRSCKGHNGLGETSNKGGNARKKDKGKIPLV